MISWQEFKAHWREAGWLDDVKVYERAEQVGPGVVSRTTVSCLKAGFPILAFAVLGFVVCSLWSLIEVIA